jgi:hypothetical protein
MIDLQLVTGVLVALAALVGLTTVLVVALYSATSVTRPGQQPPGGIRPDLPQLPQPDAGHTRELVLL